MAGTDRESAARVLHCENGNERSTLINILKLYACHCVVDVGGGGGCMKAHDRANFSHISLN